MDPVIVSHSAQWLTGRQSEMTTQYWKPLAKTYFFPNACFGHWIKPQNWACTSLSGFSLIYASTVTHPCESRVTCTSNIIRYTELGVWLCCSGCQGRHRQIHSLAPQTKTALPQVNNSIQRTGGNQIFKSTKTYRNGNPSVCLENVCKNT